MVLFPHLATSLGPNPGDFSSVSLTEGKKACVLNKLPILMLGVNLEVTAEDPQLHLERHDPQG